MNNIVFKRKLEAEELSHSKSLKDCGVSTEDEIFLFYDGIKPIKKENL